MLLVVRVAARKILLDVLFEPPNKIRIERARFLRNGVEILVWPEGMVVVGKPTKFAGCQWDNIAVGLSVGSPIDGLHVALDLPDVSRYPGDRREVIRWAKQIDWSWSG